MTIFRGGAHILMFPFPAQGHMIPLLDLAHYLATKGLAITILITPKNQPFLTPLLSLHPEINTLILPFPPHPSIPSHIENVKDLPPNSVRDVILALGDLHDPLLEWFENHPLPPVAVVFDFFLGWTHRLASRIGVKSVVFSPSGAMGLSVIYSLWRYLPLCDNDNLTAEVCFDDLPNCPKYPWWQLSSLYRSCVKGGQIQDFIRDSFWGNMESWGLVINTCSELEQDFLDHLIKVMGHDRVWAVGPLLPPDRGDDIERGGSSSVSVKQIMTWLDQCEDQEVVYVCFGSQAVLDNDQMEKLASGLEKSGVRFIWCVRDEAPIKETDPYGVVPEGFEERVKNRGLVIKGWVPQVTILNHRAVGAFLTHCGWNSIIEGLVAGVRMLTWPMAADQFVNSRLLVDELKVAKRVCEGANTVPYSEELARVVADAVFGSGGVGRERAEELRKAALDAIRDGGSSAKNLDELVTNICNGMVET